MNPSTFVSNIDKSKYNYHMGMIIGMLVQDTNFIYFICSRLYLHVEEYIVYLA